MSALENFDVQGRIDALYIHPVKSCAAIAVNEVLLTPTGLQFDREWMVIDATGRFVSQRELPRMVLIQPALTDDALILNAPAQQPCVIPFNTCGDALQVTVWDDVVAAFDMGDSAAQWLSDFLGQNVRLVRFDHAHDRLCSEKWTSTHRATTKFADGYPILISSVASIDELNIRLQEAGGAAVNALRFRPNIVLTDVAAHDEDLIDVLHIEDERIQLKNVKPCTRCPIPNIDPMTAEVDPMVSDVLLTYRRNANMDDQLTFGVNAIVLAGAGLTLRVGQSVGADYVF